MTPIRPLLAPGLALALLSTAWSAAPASSAEYGLRTGFAAARIHGEYGDAIASDRRLGFAGSLFARIPVGGMFSLQPELGWVSKGADGALTVTAITTSPGGSSQQSFGGPVEHRMDYFEIPVLLRVDLPARSFVASHVLVGPGVAFRTGSSRTSRMTTTSPSPNARVQAAMIFEKAGTFDNPRFEDVDWNVIGGAGVTLGRAPVRLVVDSRYELGLARVFPGVDWSHAHNGAWVTTLGIELR